MAKKKTIKGASIKKYNVKGNKNTKSDKPHKMTLYEKINEKIDLNRFAVPIWSIGVGLFLFLLMFLINGWQYGLLIAIPSAALIGIAVHVINK